MKFTIDGDVAQLDDILRAIADLERMASYVNDSLATARTAAAAIMLATGRKQGCTIEHDGVLHGATVKRYARTVCECHDEEPWNCPGKANPIQLTERDGDPQVYVRPLLPATGRSSGKQAA